MTDKRKDFVTTMLWKDFSKRAALSLSIRSRTRKDIRHGEVVYMSNSKLILNIFNL